MALFDDTPFTWGSNGARMTPEQTAAARKVADALALQAGDAGAFPIGTRGAGEITQGLARLAKGVSAGLDYREADAADKANADDNKAMIAALLGQSGAAPASVASTGTVPASVDVPAVALARPTAAAPDTTGKIYSNDEASPLDPPTGQDRANMIATILGEAGNEPQLGKNAVASVIRTRAVDGGYGGDTPTGVVTAPNQFEPWNTQAGRDRMARAAADPRQAAAADAAIASAYGEGGKAPEDPTEGMTHFYSPAGQAALGRTPPAWAGGETVTIGGHVFNSPDDPAAKPVQVASAGGVTPAVANVAAAADPAALPPNATPTQGYAIPGQPAPVAAAPAPAVTKVAGALGNVNPAVMQALTSPYSSDATKKVAGILLTQQLANANKEVHSQETDKDGNVWDVNKQTGERTVKLKNDEASPKWAIIGKDQYGQPTYGYTPTREEYAASKKAAAAAPAPDAGPDLTNVHGKEYLDTLTKQDPKYASQVQSILEGRAPYPTGMLLKTAYGQKLAQDVTQADPTFEAGNATARVKVRNEFESGGVSSPAGQISAGNTALQHAGEMSDALERMKADGGLLSSIGNSDIPYISKWANEFHNSSVQGTSAGKALNDFMTAKNHFSEEVTKFYAGSAGSEAERARALANLDAAKSLPELRSAIKTEANLMQGKVNALQNRWRTGMGPLVPDFQLIHPESQAAIDRVLQRDASSDTPAPAPAVPAPAIAKLAQNPTPEMKAHFDQVFGAGAADRALGGK